MTETQKEKKQYIGKLRERKTGAGKQVFRGQVCLEDLIENSKDVPKADNGKTYIPIFAQPFASGVDKHGNSHSIIVDYDKNSSWNKNPLQDDNTPEYKD